MNPFLDINFSIVEPWLDIGNGQILRGHVITDWHQQFLTSSYHCLKCGAALKWNQNIRSHYPCYNCKYDGNYEEVNYILDYEI